MKTTAFATRLTLVLGLALAQLSSCTAAPYGGTHDTAGATERLEPYVCGDIARMHTHNGVFLASQPNEADFAQAKLGGVETVINLRHAKEITQFDEGRVVRALGLNYVELPFGSPEELTDSIFDEARGLLKSAKRPIMMHCGSANRVGALWLPWRVLDGGVPLDDALAEAKVVGLRSPGLEAKALDYISRHR